MKPTAVALRVMATWAYLVAVYVVLGIVLSSNAPPPANAGPWFLLSALLTALVLCLLALRSDWRGARLAVAVSGIHAIIMLNNYLEGIVFLTDVAIDWPTEVLRAAAVSALLLPLWPLLVRSSPRPEGHFRPLAGRSTSQKLRLFVLADLAYPVLYFVAGMIVFPFIRDFYTTQTLPPGWQLFALQLLVRGPIYVGVCLLMLRMLGLNRMAGAVAVGAALVTLNGIAPLVIPSGVFPDHVRWAHLIEIAGSNLVFGFLVAWLWGPGRESPRLQLDSSTTAIRR